MLMFGLGGQKTLTDTGIKFGMKIFDSLRGDTNSVLFCLVITCLDY